MKIILPNCTIRSFRLNDAESLAGYANNRNIWLNLRDGFPYPYTVKDAITFIKSVINAPDETIFAICSDENCIGSIGFHLQQDVSSKSAEIGYWLGEPFWRKGIGSDVLEAITGYAFENFSIVRLFAYVFEWNKVSAHILEKNGYILEGILKKSIFKDNKLIDSMLYAKVI